MSKVTAYKYLRRISPLEGEHNGLNKPDSAVSKLIKSVYIDSDGHLFNQKSHYHNFVVLLRPLVKSAYQKSNFRISQPKHMLWVLKRTVSMRRFF